MTRTPNPHPSCLRMFTTPPSRWCNRRSAKRSPPPSDHHASSMPSQYGRPAAEKLCVWRQEPFPIHAIVSSVPPLCIGPICFHGSCRTLKRLGQGAGSEGISGFTTPAGATSVFAPPSVSCNYLNLQTTMGTITLSTVWWRLRVIVRKLLEERLFFCSLIGPPDVLRSVFSN